MRFSPQKSPYRRGFRLRGNIIVLLFVFFMIGLFLQYGGRTQPLVALWNDLKSIAGIGPSDRDRSEDNPYKAPEPEQRSESATDEGVVTDDKTKAKRKRNRKSQVEEEVMSAGSGNKRFDFENKPDFILPAYQPSDAIIRHDGYVLRYREPYEQADWVAYPLLANEVTGDAERDNERFQPDPLVETGSALPADYTRSGYDRGHLAPAGDFKFSQRLTRESFYMSNISPQVPDFNRGIWKSLEELVRDWAVRDRGVYVVTGPVLKSGLKTIGKQNRVAVPEQYYKVILYCNNPEIRMIGFLLTNEASEKPLRSFVVPVDQIERLTGINFFPFIPDDLENRLESSRNAAAWFE